MTHHADVDGEPGGAPEAIPDSEEEENPHEEGNPGAAAAQASKAAVMQLMGGVSHPGFVSTAGHHEDRHGPSGHCSVTGRHALDTQGFCSMTSL